MQRGYIVYRHQDRDWLTPIGEEIPPKGTIERDLLIIQVHQRRVERGIARAWRQVVATYWPIVALPWRLVERGYWTWRAKR